MRYLPYVLAVVVLAGFTAYQGILTDRWRENVEAKECADLLEAIPHTIGDWVGVDEDVPQEVLQTAGAEGYVSRLYKNSKTNQVVKVWFIVGHSFNIWRHTPTVCYRSQGFEQSSELETQTIQAEGQEPADFFTTTFKGGGSMERVFWGWSVPTREGEQVQWIAPDNARGKFGNMRALYKLYFTAGVREEDEKPDDSVCIGFAEEFLPVANNILEHGVPSPTATADESTKTEAAGSSVSESTPAAAK